MRGARTERFGAGSIQFSVERADGPVISRPVCPVAREGYTFVLPAMFFAIPAAIGTSNHLP